MPEDLLTPAAAAALLHVQRSTVIAYLRRGDLAGVKLPGRRYGTWRIRPSDLDAFLVGRETKGAKP
jgi:excisionase family DNA binding protein